MSIEEEFNKFLDRPNGGMEVEMIYAGVEMWFAITISLTAESILNNATLEDLYWKVPHYVLAVPWWIASLSTLYGLWLYYKGNEWCAWLRGVGAFVSAWIWFSMLLRGASVTGGALPTLAFYFFGALWQGRIMVTAWRRGQAARQRHVR